MASRAGNEGVDPELRIRASPLVVLRRTTEAVGFIRKMGADRLARAFRIGFD